MDMMTPIALTPLRPEQLTVRPHHLFNTQWLVLTSGDFTGGNHNCMTIAWGGIGTMWHKPVVQVVVRPQRYTYTFMETFPTFTLCGFPESYRPALQQIGSKTGRSGLNKAALAGFTAIASQTVEAPVYAEADLVIECRQLYRQTVDPSGFQSDVVANSYPQGDYHRIYVGEILAIRAAERYRL